MATSASIKVTDELTVVAYQGLWTKVVVSPEDISPLNNMLVFYNGLPNRPLAYTSSI